ncbi:peptidyl-prolyl cis-trans isomerase 6-like [Ciona intestinalis]
MAKTKSEDKPEIVTDSTNATRKRANVEAVDKDDLNSTKATPNKKKAAVPAKGKVTRQKEQKRERREDRLKEKRKKDNVQSCVKQVWLAIRPLCRRHPLAVILSIGFVLISGALYFASDSLEQRNQIKHPPVTDKVTLKISVEGGKTGELVFGLYGKSCPLTVENFVKLATHEKGYGYKGSKFYLLVPGHMIMGGDIINNNGTSGRSALDVPFENENLKLRHLSAGTLATVGLKNNSDSKFNSQFYITFGPSTSFDGTSVVFGRVLEGLDFLAYLERLTVTKEMAPVNDIVVVDGSHEKASG